MINRDDNGDFLPDTLQFIDFDNAGWGYRAWDIDYYFSYWPTWPNKTTMEDFAAAYIAEMDSRSETTLTVSQLVTEMRLHQPYLLLEQMLVYYFYFNGYQSPALLAAYCDVMLNYYHRPGAETKCRGWGYFLHHFLGQKFCIFTPSWLALQLSYYRGTKVRAT